MKIPWKDKVLNKLVGFFRKHSTTLTDEDANLFMDAIILTAGLASVVSILAEDEKYKFLHKHLVLVVERIRWVFRQLLIIYRVNYRQFLELEDRERFFTVTPDGEVTIDNRVYNVPKYLTERGFYPSLIEGAWIKPIYPEKD